MVALDTHLQDVVGHPVDCVNVERRGLGQLVHLSVDQTIISQQVCGQMRSQKK